MNDARLRQIEAAQTGVCKKVLEAVPIGEQWSVVQIATEIGRHGSAPDKRMIQGCLDSLKDSGLVRDFQGAHGGMWQRVGPKHDPSEHEPPRLRAVEQEQPAAVPLDVDLLTRAQNMADKLRSVADDIEELAIEYQRQVDKAGAGDQKLRALASVLKDIGIG